MADQKIKVVQNPNTGEVYIWGDGKFIGTKSISSLGLPEGKKNYTDQEIQDSLLKGTMGIMNILGVPQSVTEPIKSGGKFDVGQIVKDLAVDAASQGPLAMMPGGSTIKNILRGGVSLGSGIAADQLLNPQKEGGTSILEGILNTGVGMAIPGFHENKVSINPSLRLGGNPLFRMFAAINPGNIELTPRTVTKMLTGRNKKTGQFTPAVARDVPIKLTDLQNFLEGFGGNALLDTTVNRTDR